MKNLNDSSAAINCVSQQENQGDNPWCLHSLLVWEVCMQALFLDFFPQRHACEINHELHVGRTDPECDLKGNREDLCDPEARRITVGVRNEWVDFHLDCQGTRIELVQNEPIQLF